MPATPLDQRRRASVIVSKLMLICSAALVEGYVRKDDHIAGLYPEILVAMAIRVNDSKRGCKPMSILAIAKATRMPRTNVRRFLVLLVENQVVAKSGNGYVGHDGFLRDRINARYFKRMKFAICAAADALRKIE